MSGPTQMRTKLRAENGVTLIELIVASTMTLVIAVAAMGLLLTGQRQQTGQQTRVDSLDRARDGIERMTREIREAARIDAPAGGGSGQVLDIRAPVTATGGSELRLIRYDCSQASTLGNGLRKCTRAQETGAGTGALGAPVTVVDGITNTDVFTAAAGAAPRAVTVRFNQRAAGSPNPVSLLATIAIRNCTVTGLSLSVCA